MAALTSSTTNIDICARALVMIGASPITSFEDGTTESLVASNTYEDTIRSDLTLTRWRFATGQAQLSRLTDAPEGRFDAAYQLPSNTLALHTVTINDNILGYDRYENMIYCNATSSDVLIADYTYRVDEERWPPYFTVLAQYHMASIFAAAVARSAKLQELFLTQYATQLRTAKSIDGQGQPTRRVITNRFRNFRHSSSSLG